MSNLSPRYSINSTKNAPVWPLTKLESLNVALATRRGARRGSHNVSALAVHGSQQLKLLVGQSQGAESRFNQLSQTAQLVDMGAREYSGGSEGPMGEVEKAAGVLMKDLLQLSGSERGR